MPTIWYLKRCFALLAVSAAATACTVGVGAVGSAARAAPLRQVWASRGITPVTDITVAGDVAIVYGSAADLLYLYGLDAATGRQLWRHPASTSDVASGIPIWVQMIDGHLVYFRPDSARNPRTTRVVIADPATGRDLAASALGNWASSPEKCADETLCVTARVDQHDGTSIDSPYRIDTRTGATGFEQGATGFRSLGGGLTDPLQRDPELIEMRSPGRTDWSKPLAELFGDGLTTDDGWVFNQFGEVTVGTLNRPVATVQRQVQFHRNLAEDLVTAAFTTKTGALLWRRSGADVSCMNQLSINSPNGDAAPIWCRYAGTVDARYPTGPQSTPTISHPGLAVTLEQFDPATGRPVWTRPLGASEQLAGLEPGGAVRLLSDHEIRVADGSVPALVDLSTGAVSEPRSGMEFWCPVHPDVIQSPTPDPGQTQPSTRSGDQVQLCDGTGVVSSVVPTFVPLNVSRAWRQLRLVSTPVGVIAYG